MNVEPTGAITRSKAQDFRHHDDLSSIPFMRQWFHVMFSTNGTWLPGDPRGFRACRHKIHSSGNYKSPPPQGEHEGLHIYAQWKMRDDPVTLTPEQRKIVAIELIAQLHERDCEVIAIAVGGRHVHIQLRAEGHDLRKTIGLAKPYASHRLRDELPGTQWGGGCRADRVETREHQLRLFHYIRKHGREGAFVWTICRSSTTVTPAVSEK